MSATGPATEHSPASISPPPATPDASIRIAGATVLSAMVTKWPAVRRRISHATTETSPQHMPDITVS